MYLIFRYNDTLNRWIIKNLEHPNFEAYTKSGVSLALGINEWFISNDSKVNVYLTLHGDTLEVLCLLALKLTIDMGHHQNNKSAKFGDFLKDFLVNFIVKIPSQLCQSSNLS